ncbi:MAG TPA: LamG domain-containing protein [Thermoleophilaceae bacterium]|jgi:hypothetical protein
MTAAFLSSLAVAAPAAAETKAVDGTSAAFADSVGVAIHEFYPNTLYGDKAILKSMLLDLGVKHVRDGAALDREQYGNEYPSARDIASSGIKFQWVAGEPTPGSPQHADETMALLTDPNRLGGTAEALEGPNELDRLRNQDLLWSSKLYAFMGEFYPRFKADSRFASMPFYGPTFQRTETRQEYARIPGSGQLMDAPNAHVYAAGDPPETTVESETQAVAKDFGNADRKPVISETGYHTALNDVVEPGHPPASERAQSIYLLRTLLTAFAAKIPRTYVYQLLDQEPETAQRNLQEHFGLVAIDAGTVGAPPSTWTIRKKPAFNSIKELLELSADPGSGAVPKALDYSLTGSTAGIRRVLLARSGGVVDLALWREASVWNRSTKTDLFPADSSVTLQLGERADVSTERPHSQTSFTSLGRGTSFPLSVGADPLVVRIALSKYATEVRNDDPSAWLRLGEPSGAATDSAGRGATVDPWAAAPTYGQPSAVGDVDDRSVTVAPGQQATLRLPSSVSTGTGATVELWVKPATAVPDWAHFLTSGLGDWTVAMRVYQPHAGAYWGSTYGSKFGSETVFRDFDYGQWHHLVLAMGGGTSTTYLDGRKVGETSGDDALDLSTFAFGARSGSGGFAGSLDELAVYPRALSAARVCAHYRAAGGSC